MKKEQQTPRKYTLVALPGEGIGPEVVEACLRILQALAEVEGFQLQVKHGWIGEPAKARFGIALPLETLLMCEESDAILFGAVTQGGLLELRRYFELFINLRPVRPSPHLLTSSPIKPDRLQGVDLLFVRELASGIYFGTSGRDCDHGFHTMHYTDREIRRIARVALSYARDRRQHLTIAHKENALPHIPWTRLVQGEAQNFPEVRIEPMLVDNLAMQLVMRPREFDVILAGNLFGDILSDLGGAIAGSIGLLGSASLNRSGFGMYEAIHGTAPDIAGKGIANPLGTLAGVMLMLAEWGETEAVQSLSTIQDRLLSQGYRTADLYHGEESSQILVTTDELVALFVREIQNTKVS
ncbi:isocitrate/isopropylmalate dehydrogenase family protein [Spirulina sp. 06S082]|uniref:isocitrate/isopropylmalate dehydrogenase family protein n=1 Tax=Spirulina sp. 06S082 TaxID=3110248 RepID=UPI002B1EB71A|nr:isocitrate/isopropylmalate family dehydrogenase [Spirulina sp. 06S082]MEA5472133.1 isocitrate/isopropylmalate family dehydrogenase [Spirulina sp. 06S082]